MSQTNHTHPDQTLSTLRTRKATTDAQFAGRLGGNQDFIADADDQKSLLAKQPDAVEAKKL